MARTLIVIALLFGASQASAQLKAPGEVRWFMDAATNVIVNSTSFASVPIAVRPYGGPQVRGRCGVILRVSARRGMWHGTTYTLPASLKPQTTDAEWLKAVSAETV